MTSTKFEKRCGFLNFILEHSMTICGTRKISIHAQNLTKNLGENSSCQNKALKTVAKNMNEKMTQKLNELLKINDKTWIKIVSI